MITLRLFPFLFGETASSVSPRRSRSTSSVFRDALQRSGSSFCSTAGGSLPGGVVAFRRLSRMPGLLSCRHRSRDGVQRNRVRFNLIDQGSSLAGEHPSAVGRSRHTLARPKDAHSLRSVMVGGSVRPRTLERRVSSARPARSSSGERLIGCQAAPNWTVRRSAALLCPPTRIGGYGFCSGLGSKTSPLNCVYLPVNDGSRLVQSSRIVSTYSAVMAPRSAKGTPSATLSAATQPAPIPRMKRPPLSASSDETILAVTTGFRYGTMRTVVPSRTRLVAPATTASVTSGSNTVSPKLTTLACGTTT